MDTIIEHAEQFQQIAESSVERIADLAMQICRIPAPTGDEGARATFVAAEFVRRGFEAEIDAMHNVVVRRRGTGDAKSLMLVAHTDTVFPADTPLNVSRQGDELHGPGIGDNSVAVAALIELAVCLNEADIQTPGDLLLVANVGEEGLGNLRGIIAMTDRFESELGAVVALEGHMLGRITHQAVGSHRVRVTITGPGGHSWGSFPRPSAIHALGSIIHRIAALDVPADPKTTFNVGHIEGGVSINTIAPQASAMIDMRSTDPRSLDQLIQQVQSIISEQCTGELSAAVQVIGERPAGVIPTDATLVQTSHAILTALGLEPKLNASSTDANIPIARGIPAVCLGITRGRNSHRTDEAIAVPPIALGMQQLLHLIQQFPVT